MTQKEINEFLANTKVYVAGKSEEIQKKLFSLGYKWYDGWTGVEYTESPFLFIYPNMSFSRCSDMVYFSNNIKREISAEEILSLELTKPTYRPFKDKEECWEEMHKHPDFGWIKSKSTSDFYHIDLVGDKISIVDTFRGFCYLNEHFEFTDGQPFGIKEED